MNWLRRWIAAAADQDRFWREWHIQRRERRLDYFRKKRERVLIELESAETCIAYYEARLAESKPQLGEESK